MYERYKVRMAEMRESAKIILQALERITPAGAYAIDDPRITPPPKDRVYTEMEALIQHFLIYSQGFTVPAGEAYVPVEGPRGEQGFTVVSDGTNRPWRIKSRAPVAARLSGAREDDRRRPHRRRDRRDRVDRRGHGRRGPVSFHPKMAYDATFQRSDPQAGARRARRSSTPPRTGRGSIEIVRALSARTEAVRGPAGPVPRPEPAGLHHGERDAPRRRAARADARRCRGRRDLLHDVLHEAGRQIRAERVPDAVVRSERRRAGDRGAMRAPAREAGRRRTRPARSQSSRSSASGRAIARR